MEHSTSNYSNTGKHQAGHNQQHAQHEEHIVTKMAQIRRKSDEWTIYFGVLLLGLCVALIVYCTSTLGTRITSELVSFDVSAVTDVIQVVVGIFFIPFYAALSDVYGRGVILCIALLIMIAGSLITGFTTTFPQYSAGNIVFNIGETGRSLLIPIILADFLKPKNRGLGFIIYWVPSLLSLGLGIPIVEPAYEFGWRWLYRFQAIFVAITAIPILFGLFRLQRRAQNLMPSFNFKAHTLLEVDWVGITLLTIALGCILCPFTFVIRYADGWADPAIFSPVIVGAILLIVFVVWELKFTKHPIVSLKILTKRAAVTMVIIRAFLMLDSSMTWQYFNSYLMVSRGLKEGRVMEINLGYRLTWYITGGLCGLLLTKFKHVRWVVWFSIALNVIGVGLTIPSRHPGTSEGFIVFVEALIGAGAGISACAGLVVLQSTVDFEDIAKISSLDSLVTSIFVAIAGALASNVWNANLTKNLYHYLPEEYASQVPGLIANIFSLPELPAELTQNWMDAFGDTQWLMCTISLCLACFCFVISLSLPAIDLDKCQVIESTPQEEVIHEKYNA